MRQLQLRLDSARTDEALRIAEEHGALVNTVLPANRGDEDVLILLTLPNDRVGAFVGAIEERIGQAAFVLIPFGALPLQTPLGDIEAEVEDVSALSPIELVLSSLQSIGSWRGMLLYSVLAGVIGAYGVIFEIGYLLVGAMLVNPMGAPAVVAVIALAIGDARMFGRGGVRFGVSLATQAAAALALAVAYGLQVSTAMMEQIANLSAWAVLLALAAGAAGAHAQVRSERDSLVSGTAAGFMVAAALAPPAAVLGLSIAIGRWDYTGLMVFLLALQFVAIALGGWLALAAFGIRPGDPTVGRGTAHVRTALAAGLAIVTAALVWWQVEQAPGMVKGDLSRDALVLVREAVETVPEAAMIEATARFTRSDLDRAEGEALLIQIHVEALPGTAEAVESAVRRAVQEAIRATMPGVVPFVDVVSLSGPDID